MWTELPTLFNHICHDPNIRAVILSGAGSKAFTTGLDVQAASQNSILNPSTFQKTSSTPASPKETPLSPDPARIATLMRRHILQFQACLTAVANCEKPVIAALHG
ncbi:MAG: hypothetical protein Q9164_006584, partial [Protoblastenia rupestris]